MRYKLHTDIASMLRLTKISITSLLLILEIPGYTGYKISK